MKKIVTDYKDEQNDSQLKDSIPGLKILLIIVIVAVIITLILGSIVYVWLKNKKKDLESSTQDNYTNTQDQQSVPDIESQDVPSDWVTFEHSGWNYTISYPSDLYIKESPQGAKFPGDTSGSPLYGDGGQTLIISDIENMGIQNVPSDEKIHVTITTLKKEKEETLYEYLLELTENTSELTPIVINDISGYEIPGGQNTNISICLISNETSEWVYHLHGINYLNETITSENFQLMMDIINTFEFVE